jgi:hypothetical protein
MKTLCRGANKSLALPTSRCILFDGEDISFDASLVIYINSTNIPPIMVINRIYKKTLYRGADKSLARPGRKQTTATEDFGFHISCL